MFNISKKLKEASEVLDVLYTSNNMSIYSIPNDSKDKILCFGVKIYKKKGSYNNKYCRISMTEPKYIGAEGEDLVLNKEQIEQIIKILESPYNDTEYTNWQVLIIWQNWVHENTNDWVELEYFNMPDYRKLLRRNY